MWPRATPLSRTPSAYADHLGHAVQGLVDQAAFHLAASAQDALESKTEVLAEAAHGDVVLVGREPHAERVAFVEQVRKEHVDCLESEKPTPRCSGSMIRIPTSYT